MISKNIYVLPIDKKYISKIITDAPAHTGKYTEAIDFLIPIRTPIKAAADGKIIKIKQDSNIGGPDKKFINDGNFVQIKHANDEISEYEHFKHNGVIVTVGQKVTAGDVIGYSGNTGWTLAPHLHFFVFKVLDYKKKTWTGLKIKFKKD